MDRSLPDKQLLSFPLELIGMGVVDHIDSNFLEEDYHETE